MLSTSECYTAVLLECGPPQYPYGGGFEKTCRMMIIRDKVNNGSSAVTKGWYDETVASINRMSNMMERDDLDIASFVRWFEEQRDRF